MSTLSGVPVLPMGGGSTALTPLQVLVELAARLAAADRPPLAEACLLLHEALEAGGVALWRSAPEAPVLAASAGDVGTGDPAVQAALAAALAAGRATHEAPLAALPLRAAGRVIGTLLLRRATALTSEEQGLLQAAADLLAAALAGAEREARLAQEASARTAQLEEERRFVQQIIDSLPLGLYVIDRDYRIQLWNRKRETGLQGVARDEAMGRPIFDILHRQPVERLRREFDEVFDSGEVQHYDMESRASGEPRHYRISKIPMRLDDGAVTHIITLGEDVTEWRAAQQRFAQAEKLAAIGQLAAGVMHEINNPLATIAACAESLDLSLADLAEEGAPVPSACTEYVRIVESEVQRCKRIVERLLQYSRPTPLRTEPVDLNAIVEQALFLLKHHGRFKHYTVETEYAEGATPVVHGCSEQLVQVLMALLINAMDAMPEPGTIRVRTRLPAERDVAVVEVEDDGHGIPRSELSKIFEPFYTTKAPGRGTGLGLSICYGIVSEHGGTIEVDSRPGEGSTFRVSLPVARAA